MEKYNADYHHISSKVTFEVSQSKRDFAIDKQSAL